MAVHQSSEEAIFHVAREIANPAARLEYLGQMCANDSELRQRVEALLKVHESGHEFLKSALQPAVTVDYHSNGEAPGQEVGRYKLREKLGEGGFGVVWAAEQQQPVRRKVALKIIKPGMDSRDVIARFEAERQALALMDHPNIARVLDGGTTREGRPYFVMELIRGVSITEYCDANRLTVAERLRLLVDVCKAVQHAHQKGIIHRDIKPSNVLVTLHDNAPVPKVIDFGVAKALSQQLTDKTIYTRVHAAVGTLAYMAPEQAALSGQDIDTRADIYGLGVLLYELLTGTTPLDPKRLERAAFDEAIRIIREEEPPKASTRLSSLGATATAVSANRQTDPSGLQKLVRGELDWILLKALEKDRTRRYETATGLAKDINNYLNGAVVEARPHSRAYQLQKLFQRNRGLVAGVVFALTVLTLGTFISIAGWIGERRLASELQKKNEMLRQVLVDRALADAMSGNFKRAEQSIAQAQDAGANPGVVNAITGLARLFSGDVQGAQSQLIKASKVHPDSVEVWSSLFLADEAAGSYDLMGDAASKLREFTTRTESERLFRAITRIYSQPRDALRELESLERSQPRSAVLRAIKGVAGTQVGEIDNDLEQLQTALKDLEYAAAILPDAAYIQSQYLRSLVWAILLAENSDSTADSPQVRDWRQIAAKIVDRLEAHPDSERVLRLERATYYAAFGEADKYEAIRKRGLQPEHARVANLYAERDYGRFEAALDSTEFRLKELMRSFAKMEQAASSQDCARIANDAFQKISESSKSSDSHLVIALDAFLLAGDINGLIHHARGIQSRSPHFEAYSWGDMLKLLANPTPEEEAAHLKRAAPFPNRQCLAHYTIGMLALARGDRTRAKEHLNLCTQSGRINWWSHVWAEVFLQRLEQDENWPHWIEKRTSEGD